MGLFGTVGLLEPADFEPLASKVEAQCLQLHGRVLASQAGAFF